MVLCLLILLLLFPPFKESIKKLSSTLEKDSHMKVLPLTMEKKKPQPLRQFEPRVEEVYVFLNQHFLANY